MSIRIDTNQLIAGAVVVGTPGLGVRAETIPSSGDNGPSILYNDIALPADGGKEIRAQVTTWQPVASFRVELLESATANDESESARVMGYARPSRVRTWWRADVTPRHRLNLGSGRLLQILGTAELGFRQGIELACKEWAHE